MIKTFFTNTSTPIWRQIPDYPNYYVSNDGRVWSAISKKILKPQKDVKGYLRAEIRKDGKRSTIGIHRLVALAFIPNPNNYETVDHIDFNKGNNRIENLRWMDFDENTKRQKNTQKVKCVETEEIFNSQNDAAKRFGINQGGISAVISGRQKTAGGYHWELV